jgi:predicted ATP-dependent serine protease
MFRNQHSYCTSFYIIQFLVVTSLDINELEQVYQILKHPNPHNIYTENAITFLEKHSTKNLMPSFSNSIDQVLDGGLQTGCMYQFYGEAGSGKTQLWYVVLEITRMS